MTRFVTLVGYAVVAACAVGLEVSARRRQRLARFTEALDVLLGPPVLRVIVLGGWMWLGWHVFVRVDWR